MLTDAARKVASLAGRRIELPLGQPAFQPKNLYSSFDFDPKNFKTIGKAECQDPAPKIACVDGGNLPLLQTPSFAVQFERVYCNCFSGGERVKLGDSELPSRIEFFAVVTSSNSGEGITYETHLIPLNEDYKKFLPDEGDLVFDSYDETMRTGMERMEIPRVGDVARSFAEWKLSRFVASELKTGDVLVRDGTLHAPYTNQSSYADAAYDAARKSGAIFCGVSKTSHLYTTSGLPLVAAISRLARDRGIQAPWYYEHIVDIKDPSHKADLNFAKLNAASDYVFRVEILKGQEESKERAMSALAGNSRDVSFPGYPYGLVDADKNARVSYEELDALRLLLYSEMSKSGGFEAFKDFLAGSEAHEWLNRVV